MAKIGFDVLIAGLLLLLVMPTMLVIAFLIRRDGGPAMFAHERVGAGGRRFKCLKFRTMVTNSAAMLQEALERDPALAAEWAANQKLRNDPRVTRVGNFLRRTSLDELPQLINVIRLEMSLVGPRPIVSDEVRRYRQDIAFYYATRPGLTGLWQVSGRSDTTFDRRVELDSDYVKHWTFWRDLVILFKTVGVVLKRSGAH
jgi:undecaprenyl-phosphate galactose phosphotransferase